MFSQINVRTLVAGERLESSLEGAERLARVPLRQVEDNRQMSVGETHNQSNTSTTDSGKIIKN